MPNALPSGSFRMGSRSCDVGSGQVPLDQVPWWEGYLDAHSRACYDPERYKNSIPFTSINSCKLLRSQVSVVTFHTKSVMLANYCKLIIMGVSYYDKLNTHWCALIRTHLKLSSFSLATHEDGSLEI